MASICKIDGAWRALVRRAGHPSISKRFPTKAAATEWAAKIESEIKSGRTVATSSDLTVSSLIDRYRKLRDQSRPILDTSNEHYMLKAINRLLGKKLASALSVDDLIEWAKTRKDEGAGQYTVNMELSKMGTMYRYGGMGLNLPDVSQKARPMLLHLGLIGGGGKRERRPTEDELDRLIEHASPWLSDVIVFAVATAMRRGEIVRLEWSDLDEERRMVWVRNRKDPRNKAGNDEEIPILTKGWATIEKRKGLRGPDDTLIFPCHPQTLSKNFKALCDELSIPDLHFHDLRHEGTSQLFEQGFDIQQVSLVTGHKSWQNLKRYTNLKPESLHSHEAGLNNQKHLDNPHSDVSRRGK